MQLTISLNSTQDFAALNMSYFRWRLRNWLLETSLRSSSVTGLYLAFSSSHLSINIDQISINIVTVRNCYKNTCTILKVHTILDIIGLKRTHQRCPADLRILEARGLKVKFSKLSHLVIFLIFPNSPKIAISMLKRNRVKSYFVWTEWQWLLQVDNSSLTGESEPQARSPEFTHEVCQIVQLLGYHPGKGITQLAKDITLRISISMLNSPMKFDFYLSSW